MRNFNLVRRGKVLVSAALVSLGTVAGSAMAAGSDYTSITAGIDSTQIAAALVACGVILVGAGFAKWGTKKVGGFFG